MDANQAAAQEEAVVEPVADEVAPIIEPAKDDVLPSDEPEARPEPTVDELKAQIEGLEAKVKKGKDKSSRDGQEAKETREKQDHDTNVSDFYTDNLEDLIAGNLSEDASKVAEDLGISDEQLELTVLRTEKARSVVYDAAGGKETYDKMIETMTDVYTDAQKEAYTKGIADPSLAPLLVAGLISEYNKQNVNESKQPNFSEGATPSGGTSRGYTDRAAYAKDMQAMRNAPSSQQGKLQQMIDAKLGRSDSKVLMG